MLILLLLSLFFAQPSLQANMMADMAIMLGGQMGASMANQSISAMYANMGSAVAEDQNNINTSSTAFQSYVQKAGKSELKNIFKMFKTAQTRMGKLTQEQTAIMNQMDTYIQQAISLDAPQDDYILDGPSADQLFTLATMFTPKGLTWKNVFPVGNWEYDETTDSFWQMSNAPLMTSQTDPTTQAAAPSADKAPNNSIFTEWITQQSSYEILCEVTLYQVSYPFFVGIIFNKARWISGDASRLQNYRLLGLYGNSSKSIQIGYGEQYTSAASTAATSATAPTTLYPLQQIIKNSASTSQQATLNQAAFTTLQTQPATFKIKIITSPQTTAYKIWQSTTPEPQKFITVTSKNANLYLYHGIGFMAPGAIAQFKIIKPREILFSPSALQTFNAEVKTLLTKGATS
ncbi:MAG: hypothetical protein NTZ68_02625 [Candidatus Dependentiae bacterium]|nr:hypothetical protein [Candidatus Dependentiae bacterium]